MSTLSWVSSLISVYKYVLVNQKSVILCQCKNKIPLNYIICGQNLDKVSHVRDLGEILTDDLIFSEHINLIHNKSEIEDF